MKKRLIAMTLACSVVLAMTGCGNSGNSNTDGASSAATTAAAAEEAASDWENDPQAFVYGINVDDYVELPANYNAMSVEVAAPAEPTDEEVESQMQLGYESSRELVEVRGRTVVQEGDIANIDYVGRMDGEVFDGGSAEAYDLEIGSGTFIDGFEAGLVGANVGDDVTLNLTFPEEYGDTTKAGKDVQFDVHINSIMEYEPLTDELIARMGQTDEFGNAITTIDEYRAYTKAQIQEQIDADYANEVSAAISQQLVDTCVFKQDPPKAMVDRIYDSFIEQLSYTASMYGMDLETLMSLYGYDADSYEEEIRNQSADQAKEIIALQAVAVKEGLALTDEQFDAQLQEAIDGMNTSGAEVTEETEEVSEDGNTEVVVAEAEEVTEEEVVTEETAEGATDAAAAADEADASEAGSTGAAPMTRDDFPQSEILSYREYLDRQEALRFLREKTTVTAPAADEGATDAAADATAEGPAAAEEPAAAEGATDAAATDSAAAADSAAAGATAADAAEAE